MAERIAERRCLEVAAGKHTTAEPTCPAETGLLYREDLAIVPLAANAPRPPGVRIR